MSKKTPKKTARIRQDGKIDRRFKSKVLGEHYPDGRPQAEIDWATVDKLCGIFCTGDEIADIIEVDYNTLDNHTKREHGITFSEYWLKKSSKGKMSLRHKQFELARAGDRTMLVWMGKNYLQQTDKQAVDNTSSDGSMTPEAKPSKELLDDVRKIAQDILAAREAGEAEGQKDE